MATAADALARPAPGLSTVCGIVALGGKRWIEIVSTLAVLAVVLSSSVAAGAARTHGRACTTIYYPPLDGRRTPQYRDIRAAGVPCRVADTVLLRFPERVISMKYYPPHAYPPKSLTVIGRRDGWLCVDHYAHYGPPLGTGATRCTKGHKVVTATNVP